MKQFECLYYDECGLLCNQTNENCRIKELFEDFYKVEKLYIEAKAKCEQLKKENAELKARNSRGTLAFLEEDFKKEQKIKKYKQCLNEIKEIVKDFHLSMIIFHKGATHEMADRIDYYLDKIKQLINEAKERMETNKK